MRVVPVPMSVADNQGATRSWVLKPQRQPGKWIVGVTFTHIGDGIAVVTDWLVNDRQVFARLNEPKDGVDALYLPVNQYLPMNLETGGSEVRLTQRVSTDNPLEVGGIPVLWMSAGPHLPDCPK